jgi:hypothetical protein
MAITTAASRGVYLAALKRNRANELLI